MPKKSKVAIKLKKEIKKHANKARDRFKNELSMYCTAVSGMKVISTLTGTGKCKTNYIELLSEYKDVLPWKSKKEKVSRPFEACAEAKAWLEIRSQGHNPKHFTVKAHNRFFKDAPPCENCKEWVKSAFGKVLSSNQTYRQSSRQYPQDKSGYIYPQNSPRLCY